MTYTIVLLDSKQVKYLKEVIQNRVDYLVGEIVDDEDDAEVLAEHHLELQALRDIEL